MNNYKTLDLIVESSVLRVVLNRPEVHNAFNEIMIAELLAVFKGVVGETGVRSVVLTGMGNTFCAGADISMMKAAAGYTREQNVAEAKSIYQLMLTIDSCPKPVIGRINGTAVGGGAGLVSCCDIAVAVDTAKFSFSESRLGLVPAVISPFVISKIGPSTARGLFLTGERIHAEQAREIGLINHVVPASGLDEAISERINQLHAAAPGAQAVAKNLIRTIAGHDPSDLEEYLSELIADRRSSDEGKEGMNAFLEKRRPNWQNS